MTRDIGAVLETTGIKVFVIIKSRLIFRFWIEYRMSNFFFKYMEIPKEKYMKLVTYKLKEVHLLSRDKCNPVNIDKAKEPFITVRGRN